MRVDVAWFIGRTTVVGRRTRPWRARERESEWGTKEIGTRLAPSRGRRARARKLWAAVFVLFPLSLRLLLVRRLQAPQRALKQALRRGPAPPRRRPIKAPARARLPSTIPFCPRKARPAAADRAAAAKRHRLSKAQRPSNSALRNGIRSNHILRSGSRSRSTTSTSRFLSVPQCREGSNCTNCLARSFPHSAAFKATITCWWAISSWSSATILAAW